MIQATPTDTNVPLSLTFNDSSGGVTGLSAVVQIRNGSNYLDFNDNTFKAAGWTTKQAALTELQAGLYIFSGGLDLTALINLVGDHLIAEYLASSQIVSEDIIIVDVLASTDIIDGTTSLGSLFKRINAYIRGKATLATVSGTEQDIEYFSEDDITPLFKSRKAPTDRTPQ